MRYVIALTIILAACGHQDDNGARALAASKIPQDIYGDSFHYGHWDLVINGTSCSCPATVVNGDETAGTIEVVHCSPAPACPILPTDFTYVNSQNGTTICDSNNNCEVQ